MTTHRQDADLSPWGLLWGVFWRSVLWYTVAGAVLGGLYGCAIIAVAMFSTDASEAIEPSEVWAARAMVAFFGMTGFIGGWALARTLGREMRPLLGAAIGGMTGVQVGGLQYSFAYFIAFPFGAIFGGAYGLAVGFVNASLVAALTRALFFPLSEPRLYRRAVTWTSLLGVLLLPGFWFVVLIRSSGYSQIGGMTGHFWGDVLIYAGFPPLILALVAQWFGGGLATWYGIVAPRTSATTEAPTLRRTLRREKPRRIAYAALALTVLVLLAAGFRLYQTRTILTRIPSSDAALSQDGKRAAVLTPTRFVVYGVPEGQRLHALPLSREETYDLDSAVWASNGRLLATSDDDRVHVYEEAEVASLPVEAVDQLAWSPDGSLLAVSTLRGTGDPFGAKSEVRIWSRESRSWTHTLSIGDVWSDAEAFDENGHTFAATTMDDGVQLWDTSSGRLLRELRSGGQEDYSCAAYSITFSPDGELVASSGWGGVCVWNTKSGELLWEKRIQEQEVWALAFSPEGDLLASGGIAEEVKVWQASDGTLIRTHDGPEGSIGGITSVAFDPDTERVISFHSGEGVVRTWPR